MGDFCAFAFTARRRNASGFLEERQEWLQIVLGGLSPSKCVHKQGYFPNSYAKEHQFPQVFAQVWKTLGGDQTPYAALESVCRGDRTANVAYAHRSLTGWCDPH